MNKVNSGTLDALKKGEVLLIGASKVKNNKIQLEIAEIVEKSATAAPALGSILLAKLNASDERFDRTVKGRRAWITAEPKDAAEMLGLKDLADMSLYKKNPNFGNNKPYQELHVLNPTITLDGIDYFLRCKVNETLIPNSEYQVDNVSTEAKQTPEGDLCVVYKDVTDTTSGEVKRVPLAIFSNTEVVFTEKLTDKVAHNYIAHDKIVPQSELDMDNILAPVTNITYEFAEA